MSYNSKNKLPTKLSRITSVWYRHVKVYSAAIFSNSIGPFLDPLIFLAGLGMGLGMYVTNVGSISYLLFLGSGMLATTAMYGAAFECSYNTFIRLEYDKVYDAMLGAPISRSDVILGELLFVGTKGMAFTLATLIVLWAMGIVSQPLSILAVFIGFITAIMFGALSMLMTSLVKNIWHLNFYFTGLLSPMYFFSGLVFPLSNLPAILRYAAEILPLSHAVRLARLFCIPIVLDTIVLYDLLYCIVFIGVTGYFATMRLSRRMEG